MFQSFLPFNKLYFSTTVTVNQRNVTLLSREFTSESHTIVSCSVRLLMCFCFLNHRFQRVPKRVRPGKYVFHIKAVTDKDNEKFLTPTTYEHIMEVSGVGRHLCAFSVTTTTIITIKLCKVWISAKFLKSVRVPYSNNEYIG